jgi:hypothetical protein
MKTLAPNAPHKICGDEEILLTKESVFQEHTYSSGNSTWKCVALFCPNCSKNREKDTRQGGYRDRWTVAKEDFNLTLEYKQDETGFYAACSKCGHDVRNHEPKTDSYISVLLKEDNTDGPPLPLEDVREVVYKQGFVIVPFAEYERVRKIGTEKNGMVLPSITVEGQQYAISWDDFLTKMRAIPNVSVVGIPRTYWKIV